MEVVIPHTPRNNELLRRNIPFLLKYLPSDSLWILTDAENVKALGFFANGSVHLVDEDSVLPGLTLGGVKSFFSGSSVPPTRVGWYYQQFLKMAWALRADSSEWYLVWDSDTFPLRPIEAFGESGLPFFSTRKEFNPVYFETIKRLLGIEKIASRSFIAEYMTINRDMMRSLIAEIEAKNEIAGESFWEKITSAALSSSDPYRAFSEYETYGTYFSVRKPCSYEEATRKTSRKGARRFGLKPGTKDLARLARRFDIVSFERWDRIYMPIILVNKMLSVLIYPFLRERRA